MRRLLHNLRGNPALCLVVGVPLSSVLVGVLMLVLAQRSDPHHLPRVHVDQAPLSKTSWRGSEPTSESSTSTPTRVHP